MCDTNASTGRRSSHWSRARALAQQLAVPVGTSELAMGELTQAIRLELPHAPRVSVAVARAMQGSLDVTDHALCGELEQFLPPLVATNGAGHEFACALVALEAARRAGVHAHFTCSSEFPALIIEDAPGRWSALVPSFDGIQWVPMPADALADAGLSLLCPHETTRALVSLASESLPTELLADAMSALDALVA